MLFAIHGVHGSGKTFVSQPIAEDSGIKYVKSDAIELFPQITKIPSFNRQLGFAHAALAGYAYAAGIAREEHVIIDFGPRQIIPYARWWLDEPAAKEIEQLVTDAAERLERDADMVHIFFLVRRDPKRLIPRILKRQRDENVKAEETNPNYIEFVNLQFREMAQELADRGERVEIIPADAPAAEKFQKMWQILQKYGVVQ